MIFLKNAKILILTIIITIVIDFLFKKLALFFLVGEKINIVGNYIYLTYVENTGIAFSIPIEGIILKTITIILIFVIFYYYLKEEYKKNNLFVNLSFGLIIGGGIGNGYERVFNSKVIDFIGVKYFSVFNIADAAITIGAIIYILNLILINKNGNTILTKKNRN